MPGSLTLALPALALRQVFTLTTHATLRLGNLVTESAAQLRVRRTWRATTPSGGYVFDLETLARFQTPAQGSARLMAELAPLLEKLALETDAAGRLVRVVNKLQLRLLWADLLPRLRKKYRHDPDVPPALLAQLGQVLDGDDTLETTLARSPEYGLLFPPLYGQPFSPVVPVAGAALLPGFIGEIDLPLRTEALLAEGDVLPGVAGIVQVAGEVDGSHYPAAEARQALCTLTDRPTLDTRVNALHHEQYTFGPHHELVAATRHTRAEVPGVLGRQLTVLLHTRDQ